MARLKIVPVTDAVRKPEPRVARVEVELEDGLIKVWSGKDALEYVKVVDSVLVLHQLRTNTQLAIPHPTRTFRLPGAGGSHRKSKS